MYLLKGGTNWRINATQDLKFPFPTMFSLDEFWWIKSISFQGTWPVRYNQLISLSFPLVSDSWLTEGVGCFKDSKVRKNIGFRHGCLDQLCTCMDTPCWYHWVQATTTELELNSPRQPYHWVQTLPLSWNQPPPRRLRIYFWLGSPASWKPPDEWATRRLRNYFCLGSPASWKLPDEWATRRMRIYLCLANYKLMLSTSGKLEVLAQIIRMRV